jgi:DNA-binding beta-propeller fold protein YncE
MHPAGVAVDEDGQVYVADVGNHRIVQLDEDGEWMNAWGEAGEGPGQFNEVFDIAVTPDGDIAALDAKNQIISLWSADGEHLQDIGGGLALYHPRGLGISAEGDFFIADTGGGRIVQADEAGTLINTFGGPDAQLGSGQPTDAAVSDNGALYVPEPAAGLLWRVLVDGGGMQAAPGPKSNTVESPHVAVMPDGRVFLTDPENGRVLIFDEELYPLVQFGGKGTAPGQFNRTLGVAVTPGLVIVTDPDLCRVTAFSF